MANKNQTNLKKDVLNVSISTDDVLRNIIDSAQLKAGGNDLPTVDPASAGALFITGSDGMNLGNITGSGFAILCVSQG